MLKVVADSGVYVPLPLGERLESPRYACLKPESR